MTFTTNRQEIIFFATYPVIFYGLLNEPFQEVLRKKLGCLFLRKSALDRNPIPGCTNNPRPPVSQISNLPPPSPMNGPPDTALPSTKRKITFVSHQVRISPKIVTISIRQFCNILTGTCRD